MILLSVAGTVSYTHLWVAGLTHPTFSHDDPHIPADYSAVEAARSKIPSDLTLYTDATVSQLNEALNNVTEGLTKDRQSEVTAMAAAIETAVSGLIYKGADYSAVDAAAEKANALNPQEYKDFSAVEAALSAVIRGKDITEDVYKRQGYHGKNLLTSSSFRIKKRASISSSVNFLKINRSVSNAGVFKTYYLYKLKAAAFPIFLNIVQKTSLALLGRPKYF